MKAQYILILALAAGLAGSCKVNDIALYNEAPKIEFAEGASCSFDDSDYLSAYVLEDSDGYKEASFTAQLIGYFLESPRTYAVMSSPVENAVFSPELEFSNPYIFPEDLSVAEGVFKVKCPPREAVSTRNTTRTGQVNIVFDNASEYQQFDPGRVENLQCTVSVTLQIYPSDWNSNFWGAYSTSKYLLMMDVFGAVHGDIGQTNATKLEIMRAYNSYKAENGPLYGDDANSDTEIEFPN